LLSSCNLWGDDSEDSNFNTKVINKFNKMKNKEIVELMTGLTKCGELKGIKFAYAVARNASLLKAIYGDIMTQRDALSKKYGKKDKKGELVIDKGMVQLDNIPMFEKELGELMDIENKAIKFHKIKEANLPEDISAGQLTLILPIVE